MNAGKVRILDAPPTEEYDTVLVMPPCSRTGALRRHPGLRWTADAGPALPTEAPWEPRGIELLASRIACPSSAIWINPHYGAKLT